MVPIPVSDWLDTLAKLVVPLIMISAGPSFRPRAVGEYARPVAIPLGQAIVR